MAALIEIAPSPLLRPFVRYYHYTEFLLGTGIMSKSITARPEQMLQFSLREPFTVVNREYRSMARAPDVTLIGRQTRRNFDLLATGDVRTLTVHFQPAGFYRLFHVPMRHVTDLAPDASDVVGPSVRVLHEQIRDATNLDTMVGQLEDYLHGQLDYTLPLHPVHMAASSMLERPPSNDLRMTAANCGLGLRQFERTFHESVGVRPKLFSRIVRFAAAMQSKTDRPDRTWADTALGAGYFDQAHFIRDCHTFGDECPTALMDTWMDCRP